MSAHADTLPRAFSAAAERQPDRMVFAFRSGYCTRAKIEEMADRIANGLIALGVRPGDRVGIALANSLELIAWHLAAGKTGAIRLCLNPAYTERELTHILHDAAPTAVIANSDHIVTVRRALKGQNEKPWLFALGEPCDGAENCTAWTEAQNAQPQIVDRAPEDGAMLCYTSGTTGRSKGALLSHRNLLSNIRALIDLWRWTDADRLLLPLPLFHLHGLGLGVHGTLLSGGEAILHERFDAEAALDDLAKRKATMMMGVPTMYQRMLATPHWPKLDHVRLMISGSAPLSPQTWQSVKDRCGHELLERYGLSETVMNASNPFDGERRPGTVGPPVPGVKVRIDGDTEGEIQVKGPNVMLGYWQNEKATAEVTTDDGWFCTGDIGRFDANGYLVISGRSKELIIVGGYNVMPREVEDVLAMHPSVAEACVVGAPDTDLGEIPVAFLVAGEGASAVLPSNDELREHCAAHLAKYKVPRRYEWIDALPKNAMGKLLRRELEERVR